MREKTFFIIKPDAVSRGLQEEIINRIEKAGLKVVRRNKMFLDERMAADLYSPHLGKPFYPGLIKFITSGMVFCGLAEGENAVSRLREIMGATDPREAGAGTIRGDLREEDIFSPEGIMKNLVHGSDSANSAKREAGIFFKGECHEI